MDKARGNCTAGGAALPSTTRETIPTMNDPFAPLTFLRGPAMKNRFMLAPLTNQQSHSDGTLSDAEYAWLVKRAQGGFGLTMTCATCVHPAGRGFPGQLGIWSDHHLPALTHLAAAIRQAGSLSAVQLQHSGWRAPAELTGRQPAGPVEHAETGSRAMTTAEVEEAVDAFIAAAIRAEQAGFDGVELHAAHSYLICQFLDAGNQRDDGWGGSFANRRRFLDTIVAGIRRSTRPDFQLGVRLSPERHGIPTGEARELAESLMLSGAIDYVDMSLWDCFKTPVDPAYADRPLIEWFTGLPRGDCRLGVAGKIMDAATVRRCLESGADFVLLGRGAILHHDFPHRMAADPDFAAVSTPVSRDYLRAEALSDPFIDYLGRWEGFVAPATATLDADASAPSDDEMGRRR